MKFKLPEDISSLSLEDLAELRATAEADRAEILGLKDEELTIERLDEFDAIKAGLEAIDGRQAEIETAESELADRRAALRAAAEEPADEPDAPADAAPEGDEDLDVVIPDDASELEEREPVSVTASARRGAAGKAARRAPKPVDDDVTTPEDAPRVAITAAAGVPDHVQGQKLESFRELAEAFQARSRGQARQVTAREMSAKPREVLTLSGRAQNAQIGRIDKTPVVDSEFAVTSRMSTAEQFDIVMQAANERNRFGRGGLVAAGGWCAPSETIYDGFLTLETASGMLNIPEVTADRGGINITKGPDYASIAASFGFMQTEAQAEAGTEKVCYEVACPPFTEIRLDAIGFCITAGILTEAAYPELIDRVLQIGTVAHAHKVNASVITRILGYLGTAVDHAEIGATTSDLLDAAVIQATRLRYTYSMAPTQTVEAVYPVWALEIFRSDLSRRTGVDMLAIGQSDVDRYFSVRGISVQWVYDWQNFTSANTGTWTSFPDTLQFMMYPAGSFVKLTTNVISLEAIYDSVNTSTNTFTAAFFEEGLAVANTGASGVLTSVDVSALYGQTGAANLGTAAPVTP